MHTQITHICIIQTRIIHVCIVYSCSMSHLHIHTYSTNTHVVAALNYIMRTRNETYVYHIFMRHISTHTHVFYKHPHHFYTYMCNKYTQGHIRVSEFIWRVISTCIYLLYTRVHTYTYMYTQLRSRDVIPIMSISYSYVRTSQVTVRLYLYFYISISYTRNFAEGMSFL